MQKKALKKDSQTLVKKKPQVLDVLQRIDSADFAVLAGADATRFRPDGSSGGSSRSSSSGGGSSGGSGVAGEDSSSVIKQFEALRALEAAVSPILDGLSLQPDDDWANRLTIKKKKQAGASDSDAAPPEMHFSDEQLALAQRAQERWQSVSAFAQWSRRLSDASEGLNGCVANLSSSHAPETVLEKLAGRAADALRAERGVFDSALNPTLAFESSRARRLHVPCDLPALRSQLFAALAGAAADGVGVVESSLRAFRNMKPFLKKSRGPGILGMIDEAAALVALVRDELLQLWQQRQQSGGESGGGVAGGDAMAESLAAGAAALAAKREEVAPFAEQQEPDDESSDDDGV